MEINPMSIQFRVVYILNSPSKHGGATKALLNMLEGLTDKGSIPFVILPHHGGLCDELNRRNIKFILIPYFNSAYPKFYNKKNIALFIPRLLRNLLINYIATKKIITYIQEIKPDIIHTNVGPIDIGFNAAKKLKVPHVWHIREYQDLDFNMHAFPSKLIFLKKLQSEDNYPIAITRGVFNHFEMKNNAKIIYDGVLKKSKTVFIQKKEKYFLFAGRLEENKGIRNLIHAFADFTNNIKDYKLYIAGDTTDLSYKQTLVSLIKENNLCEYVVFLGMRDDICEVMAKATALVVPSFFEGFGFITVEAMFNSCLVIGNNSAGTKEILELENLGILYSGHNELVTAMQRVIRNGIESYFPMIIKAQERAVALYSQEQNVNAVYKFYNEIINNKITVIL